MAEVYLADRVSHDGAIELFALKRLLPRLAKNPIFADMFAYEATLAASLAHKNIVRCEEFFREGNDFYMAMEFVLGKEIGLLFPLSRQWQPSERIKLAVAIGLGVCDALSYVHNKCEKGGVPLGIVHGDISPQNIMINIDGVIKLYDFGAAKSSVSSLAFEEKLVRGNLRYMSPEQMAGESIQASSDVYSLCLILLELALGESQAMDRSDASIKNARLERLTDLEVPETLRHLLKEVFESGLASSPEKRLASSEDLRRRLDAIALLVKLDDPQAYLEQILKNEGATFAKDPLKRSSAVSRGYLLYFSGAAASLGLAVWVMVAIFSDMFEPKNPHILPFWPPEIPPVEVADARAVPVDVPVSMQKKRDKPVGKHGTLHVRVHPWAEVFIDGQFFGSTPMGGLNLPEGQYLVQLRNPDVSAVALKMVKIYADKKTELIHNF